MIDNRGAHDEVLYVTCTPRSEDQITDEPNSEVRKTIKIANLLIYADRAINRNKNYFKLCFAYYCATQL